MNGGLDATSTGVPGLDELMNGGLIPGRMYLVRGEPGTGKTMLGMEFLAEGLANGETALFIHGEESREDIVANATELGIDLAGANFLDLGPESDFFSEERSYDLVDPSDVGEERFVDDIRDAVEELDPDRICIDPITQLRYVESSDYQFRKRLISFMRFLKDRGTTVVVTRTQYEPSRHEDEIASLSDGIVELEHSGDSRRLRVPKHRGRGQRDGDHGMSIRENGIEVYPALVPTEHNASSPDEWLTSGNADLDELLGGGIRRGTSTFISGPTGIGKTTTATGFLVEAAREGLNPVGYLFEESIETFTRRSEAFGMPVRDLVDAGDLTLDAVDPLTLSAEEFAQRVQRQVDDAGSEFVVIDSVDGYTVTLRGEEDMLSEKLHALVRYLTNIGVTVIVLDEIETVTGLPNTTGVNVGYVADNIVFLSYVEVDDEIRRVLGVLKKRTSGFERTLHEFEMTPDGIEIIAPISGVRGVLEGDPTRPDDTDAE